MLELPHIPEGNPPTDPYYKPIKKPSDLGMTIFGAVIAANLVTSVIVFVVLVAIGVIAS